MWLTFVLNISYEAYQIGYLQKWMVSLAQACFHCSVAKLSMWFVRHAQGIHNKGHERDHRAYSSSEFFDAHLTPLGWDQVQLILLLFLQVDNLRKHIKSCGLSKRIELVIASPLLRYILCYRTMQTAVGVFGGDGYEDGVNITPPLMVENTGESGRPAISSLNCPPFMAVEDCRERLVCLRSFIRLFRNLNFIRGVNPCDKRRSISEYQKLFPAIDFSLASIYCF
ncbi:hypothetical protein BHM03_00032745 [Ensete ventricosum]|nr:hypothetical protein BHM03_00032745 [Ensete ventricosum]